MSKGEITYRVERKDEELEEDLSPPFVIIV
jgi:hypothetical protein